MRPVPTSRINVQRSVSVLTVAALFLISGVSIWVVNSQDRVDNRSRASQSTGNEIVFLDDNDNPTAFVSSPSVAVQLTSPLQEENSELYSTEVTLAEDVNFLQNPVTVPYASHPQIVMYTFSDESPGEKHLFVLFKTKDGNSEVYSQSVVLR